MFIKKNLILFGLASTLVVACSTTPSPKTLASEASPPVVVTNTPDGTVPPLSVPGDLNANNLQNTYNVPEVAQANGDTNVTLAPPGSNVEQVAQAAKMNQPAAKNNNGTVGLSAKMAYAETWKKLGKALPAAGYPVVEQDSSTGTYYVLDKVSSGGTIKRNTPIYQVRLQKENNDTLVTVLNAQNQLADQSVSSRILGAVKGKL